MPRHAWDGESMSSLNVTERLRIRSLSIERLRRQALTLTVSSPLLRWRYAGNGTDQILIVPQELRAADPSFWSEIAHGHFGLASEIADLKGASPFRAEPPSLAWARKLHGFGWLRHLAATEDEDAAAAARDFRSRMDRVAAARTRRRLRAGGRRTPADFVDRAGEHAARGSRCAVVHGDHAEHRSADRHAENDMAQCARRHSAHHLSDRARSRRSCRLRTRPPAEGGAGGARRRVETPNFE